MTNHVSAPNLSPACIIQVALEVPLYQVFDYLPLDESTARDYQAGMRVLVPFGRRSLIGLIINISSESSLDATLLKPIKQLLDTHPILDDAMLKLIRWAAEYYQEPIGQAVWTAIPRQLRMPDRALVTHRSGVRMSTQVIDLNELKRAPRQLELYTLLRQTPQGIALEALPAALKPSLNKLRERGLVQDCELALVSPTPSSPADAHPANLITPNQEQDHAIKEITNKLGSFAPILLFGITGSGKTEVYLHALQTIIDRGQQALLLVPEIGLTPQLFQRLSARLSGQIVVLHSDMAAGQYLAQWQQAQAGTAQVVIGTRSAIFAVMPKLALIIVDEEHDASLKQQDGFLYSARDLAIVRAKQVGCPIVLGSATPSLESLHNVHAGRYQQLELTQRAGGATPPRMVLLDLRNQAIQSGLSRQLRDEVNTELEQGNQVLLFLNRRGFAPVLQCEECGHAVACPHCAVNMTLHRTPARLCCHHCGYSQTVPTRCPNCQGLDLRHLGVGTEKLEAALDNLFPQARIARIDSDSTQRRGRREALFADIRDGKYNLLIGTQMLTKGHDFPGVTLVGILSIDQALLAGDFRATERAGQLIVQVAGRAGRAQRPGRMILQTRYPTHPLLQSLLHDNYLGFCDNLLAERKAAELPPFSIQVLLRADATDEEKVQAFLDRAKQLANDYDMPEDLLFMGAVPAPLAKRAGRFRYQLLLQTGQRAALLRFLAAWRVGLSVLGSKMAVRWSLDMDPQSLF